MQLKYLFMIFVAIIAIAIVGFIRYNNSVLDKAIASFEECANAGYPIMESYPPRCQAPDGQTFAQDIGNEFEKNDLIRIASPRPNTTVSRSLVITGEARGEWFFEASFPIHLKDASGENITSTVAQAEGEWMTTEFVPFQATLDIPDTFSGHAVLVLEKDNPSGLPEHADSLRVPIEVR
jgi:hypothetical protein